MRSLKKRLMAKVHKTESCWTWLGAKSKKGYGHITFSENGERRSTGAHRAAYLVFTGDFDRSLHVLHHCDNPSCVNPKHLFLGTNQDNVDDKLKKGRQLREESHPRAKLTKSQVKHIRRALMRGETMQSLSVRFNISHTVIFRIKTNFTWKDESYKAPKTAKHVRIDAVTAAELKVRLLNGESTLLLSKEYNVDRSGLYKLKKGLTWKNID